jgi:hypothetical protein
MRNKLSEMCPPGRMNRRHVGVNVLKANWETSRGPVGEAPALIAADCGRITGYPETDPTTKHSYT